MAGRKTFFSFHYQRDVWRAANVRNAGVVDATAAAGWSDASIWESARRTSDRAVQSLIDNALVGTSVTVVLIGAQTASRRWVTYEIQKSIERGNGLLGVRIHTIRDRNGYTDSPGPTPSALARGNYPVYNWDRTKFGAWVEKAAVAAGKACLSHGRTYCQWCG